MHFTERALRSCSLALKLQNRKYINYEIEQSIGRGNGLLGIQIHHLKNQFGETDFVGMRPTLLSKQGTPVFKYVDASKLKNRIEEAAALVGK